MHREAGGQSFGAFIPKGLTLDTCRRQLMTTLAKDFQVESLIVLPTEEGSTSSQDENIIIGNVALYGATSGKGIYRTVWQVSVSAVQKLRCNCSC